MIKFKNFTKSIGVKLHTPYWLFFILIGVLILRIPSFFEPYSYGDEMIYLTLGEAIRQGVPLYKGVHDNKPPLLYLLAAAAGSLFWFKAILAIWHLVTVFIFWKLVSALFPKNTLLQKIATIVFAVFTTLPLFEGNIANAEMFMIGPTILGFYLIITRRGNFKNLLLAGALFSISALFKIPAIFDFPAAIAYFVFSSKILDRKAITAIFKKTFYLTIGLVVPIGLTFIWFANTGAFKEYLIAAYLQNFGYLSTWRPDDVKQPFLIKNLPLLTRAAVVVVINLILFFKRKRLSKQFLFLSSWLTFSLFAVTLSERPYPHYFLQAIPSVSILSAMLLTINSLEQSLVILPLTLAFFVPVYFKFWHYESISYYKKFINFATGHTSKEDYFKTFNQNTPRNYKIADFLVNSSERSDKVFVWGDSPVIYALSRRLPPIKYVADYHIKDFSSTEEVVNGLSANKPKFIVILPNSNPPLEFVQLVRDNYILVESVDNADIWSLLNLDVN